MKMFAADKSSSYGPFVVSDLTNYCHQDDLEALLRRRFPATKEQPEPWKIKVSLYFLYSLASL